MIRILDDTMGNTEHLDERVMLNEMATVVNKKDGFGIEIVIHSSDHLPAHMHVNDSSTKKLIAKVCIPSSNPNGINGIQPCEGYTLNNRQKDKIFNVLISDDELGVPRWKVIKRTWDMLHPEEQI